jgi:hypothetical protein
MIMKILQDIIEEVHQDLMKQFLTDIFQNQTDVKKLLLDLIYNYMYKILSYNKFFEEVELNLAELGKTKEDGQFRGDVLVQKLKTHQPITTNNNKDIKVDKMKDYGTWVEPEKAIDNITDPDGNYDLEKAKSYFKKGNRFLKVFKDEEETEYQLNQFKKTKEFGSKGAGRLVREFESIQCIFLAIKQSDPTKIITKRNISKFFIKYKEMSDNQSLLRLSSEVDINEDLLEDFLQDENWLSTFYRIPNKLWSRLYNFIDRNKKYIIYHVGNKDVDSIYVNLASQYKKLSILGKFTDINITKWCPADVYMVSVDSKDDIINDIKSTNNINELNSVIDKYFDEKKLIPLSLKKIATSDNFKIITNREVDKNLPEFEISNIITNNEPFRGIGSKISTFSTWKYRNNKDVDHKYRVLNLDSSDSSKKQNIDGEVEGSSSRHGKISFNAMKRIIDSIRDRFSFQELQSTSQLSDLEVKELEEIASNLKNEVDKITPDNLLVHVSSQRFSKINGNKNKLISKIQSLQIVLAISQIYIQEEEKNKQVEDKHFVSNSIITKIMRYAMSIQTDKFDTPRYLRVI